MRSHLARRLDPPIELSHAIIEYAEMDGGYLTKRRLDFAPGLNAIVGDTGAGKSTFIEILRFVLSAFILPELEAKHLAIVSAGLAGGTATLGVRTIHGERYRI